ncbi:kynureninase [Pelagerythrobacter marensis]|uniref:Kynureninase n=1 Tax=Pelagerythrobacter marensis TaxID=543877 RepID=A0A0G3XBX7_9SPHN|nr:kynureninase [Pelagerythrobacter marensis]AKM08094.1 Kynureninase [Pelagerythrobacter marensis]
MLAQARARDAADPLREYRAHFALPEGVIYLDGNSLGVLPKATAGRMAGVVRGEWGEGLIRSWNSADWIGLPRRVGGRIAPLVGAAPDTVIACDSTSINLFKLIAAALAMRPGRKVVLSEPGNFPTDLYMIAGLEAQGLAERRLAPRDRIADALDGDVALLLLTHVHYKTGEVFDMAALTRAAHEAGALVLWDLSHSAGAIPVELDGCGADFAVGCGYKYLNGGPGAPAFAYVAQRHHAALEQPLTGWMGHAAPFAFSDDYQPAPGVGRLLCGTPPILGLSALEVGVDLVAEIGIERLAAKSRALSEFFRTCLDQAGVALELVSPPDPMQRGSQLSFRHPEAYAICQALIARGVIGDFRDPDILRFGFAPAYVSFEDVAEAVRHLAEVLETGEWQRDEFRERAAVT